MELEVHWKIEKNYFLNSINKTKKVKNRILKMASILVYFIILTDNFKKIGLIRVLKVAFKL